MLNGETRGGEARGEALVSVSSCKSNGNEARLNNAHPSNSLSKCDTRDKTAKTTPRPSFYLQGSDVLAVSSGILGEEAAALAICERPDLSC
jgi:hypothetical protein